MNIIKINCVKSVSLFLNENGMIYSCGKNELGLNGINVKDRQPFKGHKIQNIYMDNSNDNCNNNNNSNNIKFIDVDNGSSFVLTLSNKGNVYGWGSNINIEI